MRLKFESNSEQQGIRLVFSTSLKTDICFPFHDCLGHFDGIFWKWKHVELFRPTELRKFYYMNMMVYIWVPSRSSWWLLIYIFEIKITSLWWWIFYCDMSFRLFTLGCCCGCVDDLLMVFGSFCVWFFGLYLRKLFLRKLMWRYCLWSEIKLQWLLDGGSDTIMVCTI